MAEIHFDLTGNNSDLVRQLEETRKAINDVGKAAGQQSIRIEDLFESVSAGADKASEAVKKVGKLIDDTRGKVDAATLSLEKLNQDNQLKLEILQENGGSSAAKGQEQSTVVQSEISARTAFSDDIGKQYSELLKVASGLDIMKNALNAATGTIKLFSYENDSLTKILDKVQAAITVVTSLEQIGMALNQKSAVQLGVLGNLKKWWKNLTLQSASAQGVETAVAATGTVVNRGLAASFRGIGLAIKGIPLFGWIITGISALATVYSMWSAKVEKQKEKQEAAAAAVRQQKEAEEQLRNSVAGSVASQMLEYGKLQLTYKALGNDMNKKKKFIENNQEAFDNLNVSVKNVGDAENLFVDKESEFIASLEKRAMAAAAMELAADKYKQAIKTMLEADAYKATDDDKSIAKEAADNWWNEEVKKKKYAGLKVSKQDIISGTKYDAGDKRIAPLRKEYLAQYQHFLEMLITTEKTELENKAAEMRAEGDKNVSLGLKLNPITVKTPPKKKVNPSKDESDLEEAKAEETRKRIAKETLELQRKNKQDEINLRKEGSDKKIAQINLDYDNEIAAIKAREKEWKEAQNGELSQEQTDAISLATSYAKKRKNKGISSETLKQKWEETGKSSTFGSLFEDTSNKSIKDLRRIATEAQATLDFVKDGKWDATKGDILGISEESFNYLKATPEEIEKVQSAINETNNQTSVFDSSLKKIGGGFKKVFEKGADPKKLKEGLAEIEDGMNKAMEAGQFLSGALSGIGDAFGSDALKGVAEGMNMAMDAASSAMSGAKAGAMFGPWGAAAGAAIGLVSSLGSSLAKLHDAKHEKRILEMQEQIEVLKKSYDNLGDSVEKAYSQDASKMIAQQNEMLEQQKVLIQNQMMEERSKKKADEGKLKEYQNQIDDINKLIGENKEKQIDAILGSDVKSAINDFAQAYADAWAAGDDRAKSSKDMVKNMIKQMVMEALKAASSQPMEALRKKLAGFFSDGIISSWEREQIEKDAEALTNQLDSKFGWADEYLKGDEEEQSREASKKGIATASQESVDENNGRLTVIQEHTYGINESVKTGTICLANIDKTMTSMMTLQGTAVLHLSNIENNTARLATIEQAMFSIKTGIDTLNTNGLTLKR